ncbi:hypothetical protein [Gallaecimonas pentaromativorans]|uniref:Lipoprotein n=1 Tax=Gallaecimonas pentaromativorans TaxID=584787 RepID=A0A3N1NZD7_9GAMM|nr:hypothetical protein [Gallaecimonas pentaromativorans]MED5526268.1 hypothetical protein [Pseudomonadota bacterium]ROQ24342.1 hypothetical protein EDC28_107225 [Gallaecimonas pentaromativorans]
MQKALFLVALTLLMSGCVQTSGKDKSKPQFDVVVTQDKLEESPVKSDVLHRVQSIAVADLSAFLVNTSPENQRLYQSIVGQTTELLAEDTRYRLVGPATFAKQMRDMKVSLDLNSMSEDEINQILAKVAYSLGVHAVAVVDLKDSMGNTRWFEAPKDANVTASLTLLRTRVYMPLWQQREALAWVDVNNGLASVNDAALNEEVHSFMQPLVQSLRGDYQN